MVPLNAEGQIPCRTSNLAHMQTLLNQTKQRVLSGAQFWVKHNPHSNSNSCIQS